MFLRYVDFIFKPFRAIRQKWVTAKGVKGRVKVDVNRAKRYGKMAKGYGDQAKGYAGQAQGYVGQGKDAAQQAQGQVAGAQAGAQGGAAPMEPPPIVANRCSRPNAWRIARLAASGLLVHRARRQPA